jgi:spermidine synthase
MCTRLSAPVDYYGWEVGSYTGSIYKTIRSVFPYLLVTPTEENYFFAASDPGVLTADMDTLEKRWKNTGIRTQYFTPYHFRMWWLPARVSFVEESLKAQPAALNTDFKPVTYFFNLLLWTRFSGSHIAGVLRGLHRAGFVWYAGIITLLLAVRLVYLFVRRRSLSRRHNAFHALCAIGTTGFSAMALEIVLIFAFQNIYGYVYQMLGLIVALFMTGLAVGGFAANRLLLREDRRWNDWLIGWEFLLAGYAALVPFVIAGCDTASTGSIVLFMGLVFLSGFITGSEFPVGSKIYMLYASNVGRTAALVDGYDHFGACAGAFFTGIVAVPLLGVRETCYLLLCLNAATGLLLFVTRRLR